MGAFDVPRYRIEHHRTGLAPAILATAATIDDVMDVL